MKKIYEKPELRLTLTQVKDVLLISNNQAQVVGNDNIKNDPFDINTDD